MWSWWDPPSPEVSMWHSSPELSKLQSSQASDCCHKRAGMQVTLAALGQCMNPPKESYFKSFTKVPRRNTSWENCFLELLNCKSVMTFEALKMFFLLTSLKKCHFKKVSLFAHVQLWWVVLYTCSCVVEHSVLYDMQTKSIIIILLCKFWIHT